jgi:hypothetical protein
MESDFCCGWEAVVKLDVFVRRRGEKRRVDQGWSGMNEVRRDIAFEVGR